jgi:hypothetical protein
MITAFFLGNAGVLAVVELSGWSFLWYGPIGLLITLAIGAAFSRLFREDEAGLGYR